MRRDVTRGEVAVVLALIFALAACVLWLKSVRVDEMRGDTATFVQAAASIVHSGVPSSTLFTQTWAYQRSRIHKTTAAALARKPLSPPPQRATNLLRNHVYLVLFPLAAASLAAPAREVFLAAFVASFAIVLALCYMTLRRWRLPIGVAALFCPLVSLHPGWADSLLDGQFYPDRLFVGAGLLLFLWLDRVRAQPWHVCAIAAICACINERGAAVSGIVLVLYALLCAPSRRDRAVLAAIGGALLSYGAAGVFLDSAAGHYDGYMPQDIETARRLVSLPWLQWGTVTFLCVNAPLFLLASLRWRTAFIAVVVSALNLIGSVGGAERVGWTTHYHSFYLPVLIWAALLGTKRLFERLQAAGLSRVMPVAICFPIIFLLFLDPYAAPPRFSFDRPAATFAPHLISALITYGPRAHQLLAEERKLQEAVPEGATVSTVEQGMTALAFGRVVTMFPFGVDNARYAVLPAQRVDAADVEYLPSISVLPPPERQRVDAALVARMRWDGYDLAHPLLLQQLGIAVVRRKDRACCAAPLANRVVGTAIFGINVRHGR